MDIDTYAHGRAELSDSPTAGVSGIAIRPSSPAVRDAPANTQSSASALEAVFANLAIDGNSREDHTAPPELEHRAPRVQDALAYLDAIKKEFKDSPGVYNQFLEIMRAFKNEALSSLEVTKSIINLFAGHPVITLGFNEFLPQDCSIIQSTDGQPNHFFIVAGNDSLEVQAVRSSVLAF